MIDLSMVEDAICRLEHSEDTNFATCGKLADLYIVRDHLGQAHEPLEMYREPEEPQMYSFAPEPTDSEFIQVASSVSFERLMEVLDEHFSAIQVLYPREYSAVLKKLQE